MVTINTTLDSFVSPGFLGYEPEFGTKKPDGKSISSREAAINIAMPFQRERPFFVSEESTTTLIEANSVFDITVAGITFELGAAAYNGAEIRIINSSDGYASLLINGSETIGIASREIIGLIYLAGEWYWPNRENQAVGSKYIQEMGDLPPIEAGLPGHWEPWDGRAVSYRLGELPLPYDKYAANVAVAANQFVINQLNSGWGVYRANAAITAANNTAWNPAQWTLVLDLGDEHIPYKLYAYQQAFVVNDLCVHYWPDNYVPSQADYAPNVAYAAYAVVKVLEEVGWWKIYRAKADITAANNTAINLSQWEFVMDVRPGYKGVFLCTQANTAASTPVLAPATQWWQKGGLVPSNEYLPFAEYQQNANYNAGTVVIGHLPGASYELWKAKAAITGAAEQLDPVLFEKFELGDIVERRHLQAWIDDDFVIGDTIPDGEHAGKRVSEVICLGGTFPAYAGGNRPPYGSGVAGDASRRLWGINDDTDLNNSSHHIMRHGAFNAAIGSGVLRTKQAMGAYWSSPSVRMESGAVIEFDSGLYVPTAPEGSPITATFREWRRVA